MRCRAVMVCAGASLVACGDVGDGINPNELITTVALSFTPPGGTAITATFDDPDGDGGNPPTIDPINLVADMTYTVMVSFQNRLENPPEEITDEVRDEGAEHQVFFTGTAVVGPATSNMTGALTHSYSDMDANLLPIGLVNVMTTALGNGQLTVTLRHMPPVNGVPVKTADAATQVKTGGFDELGGETDASVTFLVATVSP
jgi:hypothetical protein